MDILIKNMEMPSCCGDCQFNEFHEANPWTTWNTCMFLNKDTNDVGNSRLAYCPLIPVPEHGELISRDSVATALRDYLLNHFGERLDEDLSNAIYAIIAEAEVVLERTT